MYREVLGNPQLLSYHFFSALCSVFSLFISENATFMLFNAAPLMITSGKGHWDHSSLELRALQMVALFLEY